MKIALKESTSRKVCKMTVFSNLQTKFQQLQGFESNAGYASKIQSSDKLDNYQASNLNRNQRPIRSFLPPTPSSTSPPSAPLSTTTMATSLNDLVPLFYGRDVNDEGAQEDPAEFVENVTFAINSQTYTNKTKKQTDRNSSNFSNSIKGKSTPLVSKA